MTDDRREMIKRMAEAMGWEFRETGALHNPTVACKPGGRWGPFNPTTNAADFIALWEWAVNKEGGNMTIQTYQEPEEKFVQVSVYKDRNKPTHKYGPGDSSYSNNHDGDLMLAVSTAVDQAIREQP